MVHRHARYDLELDSTSPLGQNIETLLSTWRACGRPSAFEKMANGELQRQPLR